MTSSKLSKLNFPAVSNGLKKIAVVVLLVGLNIYGFSIIGGTSGYFSDTETGQVTVSVGVWAVETPSPLPTPVPSGVVLNEFLPRPHGVEYGFDFGNDSSDMPQGEWVELYNNGSTDVDVTGWYLRDSTPGEGNKTPINTNHILVASPIVPTHGWLVVYMNKPIYNNTGDTVRLFNSSDTLIDSYSYGVNPDYCEQTPTPSDENAGDGSGTPPCSLGEPIPGNKSYARVPDGSGSWYDPIPTPGKPNKLTEETVTQEVAGVASGSLNSPASASLGISGGSGGVSQDPVVTGQGGTASLAPVASESVEPLVEPLPSPEASPEVSPEVTPEPADDDSSVQVPTEPAIPVEPVTPSADSGQAVEPPVDSASSPQADPPVPEPAPAPAEAPAPAPAE